MRDLALLGLAEPEAQAYAHLVEHGASTARDVSVGTGIGRSRTYGVLENLQQAGLVEILLGEPRRFLPVPPDALIEHAIKEAEQELHRLQDLRASALKAFCVPGGPVEGVTGDLRTAEGRRKASGHLARALLEADRTVSWLTTPAGFLRLANHQEGWDAIGRLVRGELDARVLLVPGGPAPGAVERAAALLPGRVRLAREAPDGLAARALVDGARLLLVSAMPDDEMAYRGDDLLLDTTVPALVADATGLFERLWARATAPEPRPRA